MASVAKEATSSDFEAREPESKVSLASEQGGAEGIKTFDVTVQIRRYNPEVSDEAHWDEFLSLIHI